MKARHLITLVLAAFIAASSQSFAAPDHNNGGKQDDKGNQQGSQKDEKQPEKQDGKKEDKKEDAANHHDGKGDQGDKSKQDDKYERSSGARVARDHNGGGKGKQESRF